MWKKSQVKEVTLPLLDFFVHISLYFNFLSYEDNFKIEKYFSSKTDHQKIKIILGKRKGLSGKNAQSMRLILLFQSIFKLETASQKCIFSLLKRIYNH